MVHHPVLLEWLVARMLPLDVLSCLLVAYFCHIAHLLHQIVHIEHQHHLALRESPLNELLG